MLRADISQFYPSIYTHSIPWAMHTKAFAKINRGNTPGDAIDTALRKMQSDQTVGIPIGPDSSLLIAELVLAAVDLELAKRHSPLRGFRYVDDYELAFRTLRDAESMRADLQGLLDEYGLQLHPQKTHILETPVPTGTPWVVELLGHPMPAPSKRVQATEVVRFFDAAFGLAARNRTDAVLKYALARAQGLTPGPNAWKTLQGMILNCVSAEPSTWPTAIALLVKRQASDNKIRKQQLADTIEATIERHAPLGQGGEVAWGLWAAIAFGCRLSREAARSVSTIKDNVVALLGLDADARGLFPKGGIDRTGWEALSLAPDSLANENWLLAYEAHRLDWIPNPTVAKEPFFRRLLKENVAFYNPRCDLESIPQAAASAPGGELPLDYL